MGAKWARGTLDMRARNMQNIHGKVRNRIVDNMQRIASEGAEEMEQNIETRGTSWSHYRANVLGRGTEGRHDEGVMVGAVDHRVTSHPKAVNAEIGWLDEFQDYFRTQELGLGVVEPMFALRDAANTMKDRLRDMGPEIIEDAKRMMR